MPEKEQTQKECRFCSQLEKEIWLDSEYFRCRIGKFDNKYGSRSFVWMGIWRANKTVAAAQNECSCFEIHPRVKLISRKGRP